MTNQDSAGTRKVVYIDDDPGMLQLTTLVLQRVLGLEVLGAEDGLVGLELIASAKPDLVLLDIMMPAMDGFEVLERLKADPDLNHVPVVMVSSSADTEAITHSLQLGAEDYITLPYVPGELVSVVRKVLRLGGDSTTQPLTDVQIRPEQIRKQTNRTVRDSPTASPPPPAQDELAPHKSKGMQRLSLNSRRALRYVHEAAIQLGHLLLALVSYKDVALDVLTAPKVTPDQVRHLTNQALQDSPAAPLRPTQVPLPSASQEEIPTFRGYNPQAEERQRFTNHAGHVLVLTQEEAQRLQHRYIGTEHLLIGLLLEEKSTGGRVLRALGLDLEGVIALVERKTRRRKPAQSSETKLSQGIKRVLELAARMARHRGYRVIGTEDLLLGLVSYDEGMAMDILAALKVTPDQIRDETSRLLRENPPAPPRPQDREPVFDVRYYPVPHRSAEHAGEKRPVWRVRFDVLNAPSRHFGLDINGEIVLGRGTGTPDMIDLTQYGGEALGVSRNHVILRPTLMNLYAMDIGSINGTLRNGQSIGVNTPYPIHDGDVLMLGRLQLMIHIVDRSKASPAMSTTIEQESAHISIESWRPGQVLRSRYQILEIIGTGRMGPIYQARDLRYARATRLCTVEEMRLLRGPSTFDPEQEAKILITLNHPSISQAYDYFNIDARAYLVQKFIQGRNLRAILNWIDCPLPVEQVGHWGIEICDALSYLHNHQPEPIVFRDIRPASVTIDKHNHVRLIGFGLARMLQMQRRIMERDWVKVGGIEGYSPPEQYKGIVSPAADIYSLGATLHHLLTRRDPCLEPPFSFHEKPIKSFNPDVSDGLAAVVMRALSYDPAQRYASAEEMKQALIMSGQL